ncbi:MAG: 23S rRNA (guanosine(2251)-2'-O)-methyltransferase RlmB [Coriobacteriia bacterium]|nr:23S rRNA (guanosine(2251)-2'-O)-methyltransferase RlmB [Coriobacteriia bacterium]
MTMEKILIAQGTKPDKTLDDIKKRANKLQISMKEVRKQELDAMSDHGAHQGVIALAAPFRFTAIEEIIKRTKDAPDSLVIVLDHITDPGNLGAIVRSAEVIGAAGVVIPKRRMAAISPVAWKASAGAFAHVAVAQETNVARALIKLKDGGFWVAGASEHATQDVWRAPLNGKIALVMGSEGEGLARLTQQTCDFLVKLPQVGNVGSLNVAQATTAISYEWLRRIQLKAGQNVGE